MKKILCLCDAGMHRSVIMAKVLRERGHFAVAGSYDNYFKYCKEYRIDFYDEDEFEFIVEMQEGGEHFIGRDELEVTDDEWEVRCIALANRLGL